MSYFSCYCPHCHTENAAFRSVADVVTNDKGNVFTLFLACNHCKCGVCATVVVSELVNVGGFFVKPAQPHSYDGDIRLSDAYAILNIYPSKESPSAPGYITENIKRCYLQGIDNLLRNQFDAAGAMFRKALDLATKELEETKGNLVNRIDALATKNKITPAMKDWAHAIRLDGNEAAHDGDPIDKETCETLKSFTELFLMYAFTLPEMLKERRAKLTS
ncbi:protein of unknown function [Humidesulfovibrio mexicanus]|uniref:DUF4145 domain-containing protein n=1 Tax=Humidesulfovibrio mexicanus TaxID=147047 RepID=A0A239AID9_9BACT|nr:DUF4145 domain-containing protein [Humidesulfovibrio mexicanus]SNR95310.1 protein of unknown function [Humidesulfovibrio mexicanus]